MTKAEKDAYIEAELILDNAYHSGDNTIYWYADRPFDLIPCIRVGALCGALMYVRAQIDPCSISARMLNQGIERKERDGDQWPDWHFGER